MPTNTELYDYLKTFLSDKRESVLDNVLKNRTKHITVVLEDIYQAHNASAVVRSCDCFGIQNLHSIENKHVYKLSNKVAMGSSKWVDIQKYNGEENNTTACINQLRTQGYKIVSTTPHTDNYTPDTLPLDQPIALCFGTEISGLSDEVLEQSDYKVRIPMYGFTESFNISVSVALILSRLVQRLHESAVSWHLSDEEQLEVKINWIKKSIRNPDALEKDFFKRFH